MFEFEHGVQVLKLQDPHPKRSGKRAIHGWVYQGVCKCKWRGEIRLNSYDAKSDNTKHLLEHSHKLS